MRRINAILSALLLAALLLHGTLASFSVLGVGSGAGRVFAWITLGLAAAHMLLGLVLTIRTLRTVKESGGRGYRRQNALFWTRRFSGISIAVLVCFHIGSFGETRVGRYTLQPFNGFRLTMQLLLIASLLVHVFVNVKPMLVSLGWAKPHERRVDVWLVLAVFFFFFTAAMLLYYFSWRLI